MSSVNLNFYAQFTANSAGATGLADVTPAVWQVTRANPPVKTTVSVSGVSVVEIGKGGYTFGMTGLNPRTYDYYATMSTTNTVDLKDVPALWTIFSPDANVALPDDTPTAGPLITSGTGVAQLAVTNGIVALSVADETRLLHLDADMSSRMASGNVTVGGYAVNPTGGTNLTSTIYSVTNKLALDVFGTYGAAYSNVYHWAGFLVGLNNNAYPAVAAVQWDDSAVGGMPNSGTVMVGAFDPSGKADALNAITGGANTIAVDASNRVKSLDSSGAAFTYTTPPTTSQIMAQLFASTSNKLTVNADGSVNADATVDSAALAAALADPLATAVAAAINGKTGIF